MELVLVILLAAVVALILLELVRAARARRRDTPDLLRHGALGLEVAVHTRRPDDQSILGVLVRIEPAWLELGNATYLEASGSRRAMGGAVLVPREHVAMLQVLEPDGAQLEPLGQPPAAAPPAPAVSVR